MGEIGVAVYASLKKEQPPVGTTIFGTDPLADGEASIAGYTSGHVDLKVVVGKRYAKISIDSAGKILGYASAVAEGQHMPLALVTSKEINRDEDGAFIEVQPTRDDRPDKPAGSSRRLRYVGPSLD